MSTKHVDGRACPCTYHHAMLMIFFFIMPGVMSGLGNLLVPIQLCVPELVFPKVNNLGMCVESHVVPPVLTPFHCVTGVVRLSYNTVCCMRCEVTLSPLSTYHAGT